MADYLSNIKRLSAKPEIWDWVGDMYLAGNDCGVAMRLADGQEYEPQSRKLWKSLCKDVLVIDIGAHTGRYSLDAWKAGAENVLSVEPYHLNYARLVMNLHHSGFSAESSVFCAVGDENAIGKFSVSKQIRFYCTAGGFLGGSGGVEFLVNVRRLDSLLRPEHHAKVAAVKIDTERHGVRVLRGMPKILEHKPDLILECIEYGMGEILKPLGYSFYKINEKTGLVPVDDLVPDDPFTFDSSNRYATVKGT